MSSSRRSSLARRLEDGSKWVAETSPRESIRSVEKPGHGRDRGWMSRQPFLALCDVHGVCCILKSRSRTSIFSW
jgi:hypothetical protein